MWQLLLICAGIVPALTLLAAVSFDRWQRKRRRENAPLKEKLLRPTGYSSQRKIKDLDERFTMWFMGTFVFSLLVVIFPQTRPADVSAPFVSVVVFGSIAAACTVMALRKLFRIRAYRRGLLGEQAVAEQLQPLLANGYRIFHDIPCSNNNCKWNIDHVAVGPGGVFAIETKYRTKKPGKDGGPDHKATFDGNRIKFASGDYDAKAVGQARNNARWLEVEMSKAIGERVTAQPIVALPGWYVTLKANSDVKVLSGKQIHSFISTEPARLSDEIIKSISYQLDRLCRDVEF